MCTPRYGAIKWASCVLLVLLAVVAVGPAGAADVTVFLVRNSILGIGAAHPSIDPGALNRLCTSQGGQTTRVWSAAMQKALDNVMDYNSVERAYLGAKYVSGELTDDWLWMPDNWVGPGYPFCRGYSPCTPLMYTNWARGFPQSEGSDQTHVRYLLHEKNSGGWCNRRGLALTTYYAACSIGDTTIPTIDPNARTEKPTLPGRDPTFYADGSSFPKWAVGVILGVAAAVASILIGAVVAWFCCCRKLKEEEEDEQSDSGTARGDDEELGSRRSRRSSFKAYGEHEDEMENRSLS